MYRVLLECVYEITFSTKNLSRNLWAVAQFDFQVLSVIISILGPANNIETFAGVDELSAYAVRVRVCNIKKRNEENILFTVLLSQGVN
jgi:hypothetical protein